MAPNRPRPRPRRRPRLFAARECGRPSRSPGRPKGALGSGHPPGVSPRRGRFTRPESPPSGALRSGPPFPRAPFGHPGLRLRRPLRGLGCLAALWTALFAVRVLPGVQAGQEAAWQANAKGLCEGPLSSLVLRVKIGKTLDLYAPGARRTPAGTPSALPTSRSPPSASPPPSPWPPSSARATGRTARPSSQWRAAQSSRSTPACSPPASSSRPPPTASASSPASTSAWSLSTTILAASSRITLSAAFEEQGWATLYHLGHPNRFLPWMGKPEESEDRRPLARTRRSVHLNKLAETLPRL